MSQNEQALDDLGTDQPQAERMLKKLLYEGFSGDLDRLALALGRESAEINGLIKGDALVDEDLLMKIRGIAEERNVKIE